MYWTTHLSGGPQRVNHAAVIVGDKIYSFGGYCSGENYREERPIDVHILNTADLRWKVFVPEVVRTPYNVEGLVGSHYNTPFQRYGHTAVAHGTKVYVWGGRNDTQACNRLYCFDTERLEWLRKTTSGSTPGPRDGHSACIIDDDMYIFGGFEDDEDRFSQDVYKLNLNTFVWQFVKTKGEPPSYRDFHSATSIGNRMFVFGGRGDLSAPYHTQLERYCNNIVYLDTKENMWHMPATSGCLPQGRRSHSAFVYKGEIYIFGGYNSLKPMHFNDLHRFNPNTFCWQEVHPMGVPPSKRRRQSCVVSGDRMFLFGGTSPVESEGNTNAEEEVVMDPDNAESRLNDHDDLHILEFDPSLVTLCLVAVIQNKIDVSQLPETLKREHRVMTTTNTILRMPTTG